MRETTVSRRTFLKGSAATAALACAAGSISLGSWQAERAAAAEPAVTATAPSLCNGCSSKCGLIATTVDGQLWTLKGNEVHPYSKGRICGRGHGLAQMAYSDERVTQPLRRKDDGTFEPIDWDTAFKEIGAKVQDIIAKNGPESLAIIQDPRPSGKQYSARFKAPAKPAAKRIGDAEYPLVLPSAGTNVAALQATLEGEIKGLFFYNSNAAKGYAQPKKWTEALEKTDLVVTIDVQMSETAQQSDYVLPEVTYLERLELPEFVGGKKHYVGMRTVALEKIHPETRTCDEIFNGLAEACGVGEYFQFTAEDWAEAQLATVGVSLDQMKKEGVVELPDPHFEYGVPTFKTASGKFEFKTDKVGEAGLNPVIGWIPRKVTPQSGEFAIVGGKQGIHSHTMTQNIEALHAISREYHMERLWMAAKDAADLGVQTGDTVEVSSSEHTGQVEVRVTQRLKPGVVFLPTHYGGDAPAQTRAYHYGISLTDFIPLDAEPGVGSMMSQEVAVTVKKVEA